MLFINQYKANPKGANKEIDTDNMASLRHILVHLHCHLFLVISLFSFVLIKSLLSSTSSLFLFFDKLVVNLIEIIEEITYNTGIILNSYIFKIFLRNFT